MYSNNYQPNYDIIAAYKKQIKKEKAKRLLKKISIIISMLLIIALFCFKTVNKVEKKQQQKKLNDLISSIEDYQPDTLETLIISLE